jgi:hypothetical protein
VPGLTTAPGTAGGVETTDLPDAGGVVAAGAVSGAVAPGVFAVALPGGSG